LTLQEREEGRLEMMRLFDGFEAALSEVLRGGERLAVLVPN
jgi:hypothetical protein